MFRSPYISSFDLPVRLFDQHFGSGLFDDDLIPAICPSMNAYALAHPHHRPRRLHSRQQSGTSQLALSKDNYEMKLDVQQFLPEEIVVKTADNYVIVEGKHEEKQDQHGYISRQFVRKYLLPEWVKPDAVVCNLSSDGVLSITAPKKQPELAEGKEKILQINQTGQPAIASGTDQPDAQEQQKQQKLAMQNGDKN